MFADRRDAAKKLGHALEKYRHVNALVLGIPRGGVETAYHVAKHLDGDLNLAVTRKLGYPLNPELAFGALAEDGSIYIFPTAKDDLTREQIDTVIAQQEKEIVKRIQILRKGKPLPDMEGRTVVIVDDGIATGATIFSTIALCKNRKAGKIIVASPIASESMKATLKKMVDEVIILETPYDYSAVSRGYETFYNLNDSEALAFMDKWEEEHPAHQHQTS